MAKMGNALAAALLMVAAIATVLDAPRAQDGDSAEDVFHDHISGPIVQSRCVNCHVDGGLSGHTRLVLARSTQADHEALNLRAFEALLDAVENEGGASYILNKIQGVAHGGGAQVPAGSTDFVNMQWFLGLLDGGSGSARASLTPETLFDTVRLAPDWKTLRRAALIFAGRIPTEAEYAAVESGRESDLRAAIRGFMEGPEFHEFLIRGSNDRLLTERTGWTIDPNERHFVDFTNEAYQRKKDSQASGNDGDLYDWMDRVQFGFRRAPLELIAHVAQNDLPYTEILTADYIMANPWSAKAYGASTTFSDPQDVYEFRPSEILGYYRFGGGFEADYDPILQASVVHNRGSLITDYPHAGILNTISFLRRYPTTATNRNRARARWTYYHFLGLDIEKSAPRTTDPVALADSNNPTMNNPNCTVCHSVMDPVAGSFRYYSDDGFYKHAWEGLDSLDELYKRGAPEPVKAETWAQRETLSWRLHMAAGTQTLRVLHTNHFWDEAANEGGEVFFDRLEVVDGSGSVVASREFEDLDAPRAEWGPCGEARSSQGNGSNDHFVLRGGWFHCVFYIDVEIASADVYDVDIVAWSNGPDDRYHSPTGFADISVVANGYEEGDAWYLDMRTPGFAGAMVPDADSGVQWLARHIVADERFAEATVKFWWPAIMGSEIAEFPEEASDADFEGRLLAATAQDQEVARLAGGFRDGFAGSSYTYNLKDLLVEIVLSKWFRADAVTDADPVRRTALRDAGARRLLTPEELARKTAAITGVQWGRDLGRFYLSDRGRRFNALTEDYRLLYGGIDSDGITERARDLTSVMAAVSKRHAVQVGCPAVLRDFFLLPDGQRRLFGDIEPTERSAEAVKAKLVELHDKLLGVRVTSDSADVEAAYQLFVDVSTRGRKAGRDRFEWWRCQFSHDDHFLKGIYEDALVRFEHDDDRWWWHDLDWDRLNAFMNRRDFSDPHHTAQAWVVVLTAMLMDYRYLYL